MPNETNDDDIIAKCFLQIREGILSQDWQVILSAYNEMSGEQLELPAKKKSRLEQIREKMGVSVDPTEPEEKPKATKKTRNKKTAKEVDGEPVVDGAGITTSKHSGGKRFAEKGFEVVSVPMDEDEIAQNKKLSKKKVKMPRSPTDVKAELESLTKRSEDPNREIGYRDTPRIKPPWS